VQGALIGATIGPVRVAFLLASLLFLPLSLAGCFNASCKPQEVHGTNMTCGGGARGYMWTGTSCIYTVACNCTGEDCQRLYSTQDGCETAHIHCR
jgi:hypothetical protein